MANLTKRFIICITSSTKAWKISIILDQRNFFESLIFCPINTLEWSKNHLTLLSFFLCKYFVLIWLDQCIKFLVDKIHWKNRNFCALNLEWLKAIGLLLVPHEQWRLFSKFFLLLAKRLQNPPANGKQGLVPDTKSQTLLTNKKQGKNY